MKYPILFAAVLIASVLFTSCQYSEVDKTYAYSDEWAIDYPSWFRKSKYVYPGSEFQVSNGYRDTYAFVREVITPLDPGPARDSLLSALMDMLEDPRILSDSTFNINDATFMTTELTGRLEDKLMYYLHSVIISEGRILHFSGWMFNTKRELWEQDFKDMLYSWRNL
jgi:hypothetical protein